MPDLGQPIIPASEGVVKKFNPNIEKLVFIYQDAYNSLTFPNFLSQHRLFTYIFITRNASICNTYKYICIYMNKIMFACL